jgi:hypothetical protein
VGHFQCSPRQTIEQQADIEVCRDHCIQCQPLLIDRVRYSRRRDFVRVFRMLFSAKAKTNSQNISSHLVRLQMATSPTRPGIVTYQLLLPSSSAAGRNDSVWYVIRSRAAVESRQPTLPFQLYETTSGRGSYNQTCFLTSHSFYGMVQTPE